MTTAHLLDRYRRDALQSASPGALVVQLYDYLVADLGVAERAIEAGDVRGSHEALIHAQRIVDMLRGTLRVDLWAGAADLQRIYDFLWQELVRANLYKEVGRVRDCLDIVRPLHEAWRAVSAGSAGGLPAPA
jgi:flagellar protein FliS